jgi:tRNA A37 methylthiotransferase MiaB
VQRLTEVERELQMAYYRSLIGRRLSVLVEGELAPGRWAGTSCRYAPVELPAGEFGEYSLIEATATALRIADCGLRIEAG